MIALYAIVGNVEEGVLWYASKLLCNTFDLLRCILPMSPKLAVVGGVRGLKRGPH
jgi:hypothetical protein